MTATQQEERTLTPDDWAMLPKATTDALTWWWEGQDRGPITDITLLTLKPEGAIEVVRVIRDKHGAIQLDPDSGTPATEFLKETVRFMPTTSVPEWWSA